MPSEIFKVPVTKAKTTIDVEVSPETIPDHVYKAVFAEGLKVFVNKGMAKIKVKDLSEADAASAQAAAIAQAEKNVQAMHDGTIKLGRAKAADGKVSGKVKTEAMRIARALVKEELKRMKKKVSHYEAKDISAAAAALIEANPVIIAKAKAAIEAQEAEAANVGSTIDISSIAISPTKIRAAEAKKAAGKTTLSATQAGKPAKRKKGETAQANA